MPPSPVRRQPPTVHQHLALSTPGLKTDCETLLSRFQETDSVRFEVFSSLWRSMKFSTIFNGKLGNLEKNKFTREALATASQFFFPPFTFQIRVGALYLLYGLFNTQLCQPKQKIRIALKDWSEILRFQQDLINAQHFDAAYIFRKLRILKAFHYTAMPKLLTYRTNRKTVMASAREEFKESKDRVTELITSDVLEEIMNVQEHYQKMKCVISSNKSQPDKALSLIRDDFVMDLKSLVLDHQRKGLDKKSLKVKRSSVEKDDQESTSQESESWERARTIAAIKSKSYSTAVQAPKSRRHRQVKVESSESGSDQGKKKLTREQRTRKRLHPRWRKHSEEAPVSDEEIRGTLSMPVIIEEDSSSEQEAPCVKKKRRIGKALKKH
ncbi:snRNA-activating protein complex subunit 1 [Ambystoma mexicanum]|uniref:snRNA-activating protein complex subunit 1 n=1 Tax=Ambystoma mexicanum TaxID=8296 RepID=UPI0037E74EC9